ncbi:MAG: hypothetical protein HC848_09585 [Limnobacter sp.]|nr:hypothetical protein [Limnobacter sp.]
MQWWRVLLKFFSARALGMACTTAYAVLIARAAGPEQYGRYSYILIFFGLFSIPAGVVGPIF